MQRVIDYLQTSLDGALFGTTYSLLGIGFTLVFGVMRRINMGYAAASLAAAYTGLLIQSLVPHSVVAVILTATVFGAIFGLLIYLACFRFIPRHGELASLMASIGALLLFEELTVHGTQGMPTDYPSIGGGRPIDIGPFSIRPDLAIVFLICILTMVAFVTVLYRTRLGAATRAVSQQPIAAQLCGVPIERINAYTFLLTGALGGLAGSLIGTAVGVLSPMLALPLSIKGLIVAVIGGLGSIGGAIVAGMMIGVLENVFQDLRSVTERDIYVMLVLFLFLLFRPSGLFGKHRFRD